MKLYLARAMTRMVAGLAAATLLTLTVQAGALSDAVLAPGGFAGAESGVLLTYSHTRTLPPSAARSNLVDTRVWLQSDPGEHGPVLSLFQESDGKARPIAAFPAQGANPVLLYYLEGVVHAMAEATGGSPFYIRNRIRDALVMAPAGEVTDGRVTAVVTPFARDPNRAHMGSFGDLTLTLTYPSAAPTRLLSLSADTPGGDTGYHDTMHLMGE
ncbi:hypothetical protein CDV50_01110 [Haematobacter massiliensis]|uniref:Uncharacterized protein n=1 Tax=Haematobacter massiliensis TaxID=195105 RepID=A0A086Y2V0_9RHOB|nr:hypothetical protein [Haematobacter massiliensis]KFI28600.1 hypothetical protein CN97_17800 [Haematobacter massiliensis]OWJ74076.1 hypothetical protein CDV50_01110 [Haematobacter massiliensis]OWJ88537.1 hypothetical protein CDV51_00710 [Haematobacter massiliensis]QBJ26147.1 hypothetical protein HmaOT1_17560 [Haematobacter massiliensis]